MRRRVDDWPGHPLLYSVSFGDFEHGECTHGLDLIGLDPDGLAFSRETWIGANDNTCSNTGFSRGRDGFVECRDAVKPGFESPPERRYKDYAECNVVKGHWWIDGDGLEFVYRRATREVNDDGHLTPTKQWTEHMRLEMRKGELAVVGGREPLYAVPERQQ